MKVVLDACLKEQTGCLFFFVEPRREDRLKQKDVPVERSIPFLWLNPSAKKHLVTVTLGLSRICSTSLSRV